MKKQCRFLCGLILCCAFAPIDAFAARNAVKKNAIDLGTKVEVAVEMKSSSCTEKYTACMDAGCMVDNESGGRCQCSNKIKDLDAVFEKLRKKEYQTERLSTFGKEIIEMGKYEDELLDGEFSDDELSESEDLHASGSVGDRLRAEMHDICIEKLPECKSQLTLITNLYAQKIKSDCAAYENILSVKNQEAKERRADAKKAVRTAALEQYQASNKYDLGQCVIEFTSCMKTTAECGNDWTGCVGNLGVAKMYSDTINQVAVKGINSSVMIAKSTMEVLEAKKVMCESVTKQCVAVKDQVWDGFLRNAIPDIKSAEMLAESNARTSCLTNISNCFLNACKDNIDDKKPDSYDLCLTRPEAMKNLCKVELEPCMVATGGSYDKPDESTLWPAVLSKLAAMRVDSCTTDLKDCLQSEDRCGKDYSQCIGLDTNIIMRMCPYDKLVGCQKVYGKEKILADDDIYDEVARIVEGIILNVDNEMLNTCEVAVETAMTKVCGDAEACAAYAVGDSLGANSLRYNICQWSSNGPDTTEGFKWFDCRESVDQISDAELGRAENAKREDEGYVKPFAGVISGVIRWESLQINDDGYIDIDGYIKALEKEKITDEEKVRVRSELDQMQADINRVITSVETDQWVSFCTTGRKVPGVTDRFANNTVRFPKLANTVRKQMATAALQQAKTNYYRKYDQLTDRMAQDGVKIYERIAHNIDENEKDVRSAAAQAACVNLAASSAFAKAPVGQNILAKAMALVVVAIATVVASIFTFGVAGVAVGAAFGAVAAGVALSAGVAGMGISISAGAIVAATMITAAGLAATAAIVSTEIANAVEATGAENALKSEKQSFEKQAKSNTPPTHGQYFATDWNYQEKITTDFDRETMTCKRCITSRKCKKGKWSLVRNRYCVSWEKWEEEPRCNELQF